MTATLTSPVPAAECGGEPGAVLNWERIARTEQHELRTRILELLAASGVPMSPKTLTRLLGPSLSLVSYHVRILCELGLVELVGTAARRGAIEHFYRPAPGVLAGARRR